MLVPPLREGSSRHEGRPSALVGIFVFISPAVRLHLRSFGVCSPASMLECPPIIYPSQRALCPFSRPFHMHQRTIRVHLRAPRSFATSRHMPDQVEAASVCAGASDWRGSRKRWRCGPGWKGDITPATPWFFVVAVGGGWWWWQVPVMVAVGGAVGARSLGQQCVVREQMVRLQALMHCDRH